MAFNFYDTHTLLASVQQLPPLHSFLLDRYFPTNAASDVFATDDVLVEYRYGEQAAYQQRTINKVAGQGTMIKITIPIYEVTA